MKSKKSMEFAYELEAIDFQFKTDGTPERVTLKPSSLNNLSHASAWEKTRPLLTEGGPEQFTRVKLFYATNRDLTPSTPAQLKKTWWTFFGSYFMTANPYIIFVTVVAIMGFSLLVKCIRVRSRWLLIPLFLFVPTLIPCAVAAYYAGQETKNPGAITELPSSSGRGTLTYGTCDVSIPKNHKIGEMPRPISIFLIELQPEDPTKTISVLERRATSESQFFKELGARIETSPKGECFVFVHGYNNSFTDAAHRTAQLWYDLQFQGAPIFFSWPSRGALAAYTVDENEAEWSETDFETFLGQLQADPSIKRIHLIAHSMGNRIVTKTLAKIAQSGKLNTTDCKFREIILAAADIDAGTFKSGIAPRFLNQSPRITFYASSNDEALKFSNTVHGYSRAGDANQGVIVMPGMDSIDASLVDTSFDNHGYFAAQRTVIADIELLLKVGSPPSHRGLKEDGAGTLKHWIFRP